MRMLSLTCLLCLSLLGCGDDGDGTGDSGTGGSGGSGGESGSSGSGGTGGTGGTGGMTGDGGMMLSGPLALDVTDVVTSTYEDCIEPTIGVPTAVGAASKLYFEAKTGSDTSPPPDWTVAADCTAGDAGLVCNGTSDTVILTYTGPGMLGVVTFDAVHPSGINVTLGNYSHLVNDTKQRLSFVTFLSNGDPLQRSTTAGELTISNVDIRPLAAPTANSVANNTRTVFTLDTPIVVEGAEMQDGENYIASFVVPADGMYNVGRLCTSANNGGTSCVGSPGCTLYDAAGTQDGLGEFEWDSTVDPNDANNPFSDPETIKRTVSERMLTAGTYHIVCSSDARVFVRTFDDSLVRSCSYLTWYFSLRQGGEPVTGLQVESITPTVDGRDLGVEAGAALTQNNTSRVALLLDRSFSITQAMATSSVQSAAKAFIDAMPEGTYYQVHQFASEDDVSLAIQPTPSSDLDTVKASIDAYDPWPVSNSQGFTKLFDAIGRTTVQGYNDASGTYPPPNFDYLQRVMIVFTDGEDTASTIFVRDGVPASDLVVRQLEICRVNALSVGLGAGIEENTLRSLTGDSFYLAEDNDSLLMTFQDVADDLNSRYRFKMVTPQPVMISNSSSLQIDVNGESVTSVYEPPTEACQLHDTPPTFSTSNSSEI